MLQIASKSCICTLYVRFFIIQYNNGQFKQEQTKFDDLRRGITKDIQRFAKFQRTLLKRTKKKSPILSDSRFWPFLTPNDLKTQIWPDPPNII